MIPKYSSNLWQRLSQDIEYIITCYQNPQEYELHRDLLTVPEPVSLYQQSKQEKPKDYKLGTPNMSDDQGDHDLTNWNELVLANVDENDEDLDKHQTKKETLIR